MDELLMDEQATAEVRTFELPRTVADGAPLVVRGRVIGESARVLPPVGRCRIIAIADNPWMAYALAEASEFTDQGNITHRGANAWPFRDEQALYLAVVTGDLIGPTDPDGARAAAWMQAKQHPPLAAFLARLRADAQARRDAGARAAGRYI